MVTVARRRMCRLLSGALKSHATGQTLGAFGWIIDRRDLLPGDPPDTLARLAVAWAINQTQQSEDNRACTVEWPL